MSAELHTPCSPVCLSALNGVGWMERGCHVWRHYVRRVGAPENSLTPPPLKVGRFSALTDWWGEEGGREGRKGLLFTAALSTPSLLLAPCSHMKGGREMDDECINWGWHSFPGQMRPAAAGRPPDLECGRGWRDSLTFVRSAFAFYSHTPSQKTQGCAVLHAV